MSEIIVYAVTWSSISPRENGNFPLHDIDYVQESLCVLVL